MAPIDKNHLPPELAAQILEREALTILAEECGEVVQRCTKILRFGFTTNPWTGKHNGDQLELELGDVQAIQRVLDALGVVDAERISGYASDKIRALRKLDGRLRHARVPAAKGRP